MISFDCKQKVGFLKKSAERWSMIGRNFIVKNSEIFSEHNTEDFARKLLTEKLSKSQMISLSYDINDTYTKSQNPSNFANIEVVRILILS